MTERIAKLPDAELSYLAESGARISEETTRALAAEVLELRQEAYNMTGELKVLYAADRKRQAAAVTSGAEDLAAANVDAGLPLFASRSLAEIEAHLAAVEKSDCRCSDSTHENAVHDLVHIDVPVLVAEVKRLRQKLTDVRELARGYQLLTAGGEEEIAELAAVLETVKAHINRRPEVITALEQRQVADADYWRWQGHAEAMGNLARDLGLTVPHKPGETTEPVTPKEATTNA